MDKNKSQQQSKRSDIMLNEPIARIIPKMAVPILKNMKKKINLAADIK